MTATIERNVQARRVANMLVELGIELAAEEGLTDGEVNRRFWFCVVEAIGVLVGTDFVEAEEDAKRRAGAEPRREDPLEDDDEMPFGKYKGEPMREVPEDYLLWLADQEWIERWPRLLGYINQEVG